MKAYVIVGALLIALGLIGLVAGGITYTKEKDTADLGPVGITVEQKKKVPIPPAVSVVSVIAGVGLLLVGSRRRGA
jgi:hypothetical protein